MEGAGAHEWWCPLGGIHVEIIRLPESRKTSTSSRKNCKEILKLDFGRWMVGGKFSSDWGWNELSLGPEVTKEYRIDTIKSN